MFTYYMMLAMSVIFQFVLRSNALRAMDAACDTLLVYVIGVMQTAPFKNELFPIWAILLVSSRSAFNTMSKYDTYFELRNMLKLWAAALLNVKHGSKLLRAPFWLFWGILVIESSYRIRARKLASKSLWHGRSSELVREYMVAVDHDLSNFNPDTLEGCKFLVYGELKKNITKGLSPSIDDLKSVVSLDNIWLHDGSPLLCLRKANGQKNTIKDLALSFALSRLLRCRMEGGRLHEDTISMTKEVICSQIIKANDYADSALAGILQMELLYLGQHIHTGYPMVFCQGLRSLYFPALQCVVRLTCLVWLLADTWNSKIDKYITGDAIILLLLMEMFQVVRYVSSNWTVLLLACNYVNGCRNKLIEHVLERMISSVPSYFSEDLPILISSRYDFLQSSKYSKGKLRPRSCLAGELTSTYCCETVIAAVIRALARYMEGEGNQLPSHRLPSPRVSDRAQRYWSECLELPSCSHVILVWHIATSLCQVKFEHDGGNTDRGDRYRLFVGNIRYDIARDLSKANTVANCLSSYCLQLLIAKPNLLPENVFVSKKLLLDTIQHAHDILRSCKSAQSKYDELIALSEEAAIPAISQQNIELTGNILIQGATMGKKLIDSEDEEGRWDILAEVWADILIQIAPSSKAEAHGKALEFKTELVTLVWAPLCHCGIEKSELWPEER